VPVLTGLAPDPHRPGHHVVEVDRGRFASVPSDALAGVRLALGEEIPVRVLQQLHEVADVEAARRGALRLLALRAHAAAEVRRRLLKRQHPPRAIETVLRELAARGLLDDRAFGEAFAAARARRGRGPSRILAELIGRGVDRGVAERAVAAALAAEHIDPLAEARRVALRQAAALAGLPAGERRRRLVAFLLRRGYAPGDARLVAGEACPNS
jgi:regulatory protein